MGIWSSIREFCQKWKPEIRLYGIGFLLLASALVTEKWAAAAIVFFGVCLLDVMRRLGEPWRQLGEKEMERRRLQNQALWREQVSAWMGRLRSEPPPPEPNGQTRLIPAPMRDGEEPPESPAPIRESEKPAPVIPPPVTHDT